MDGGGSYEVLSLVALVVVFFVVLLHHCGGVVVVVVAHGGVVVHVIAARNHVCSSSFIYNINKNRFQSSKSENYCTTAVFSTTSRRILKEE